MPVFRSVVMMLGTLFCCLLARGVAELRNKEVVRTIDASTSFVRISVEIKVLGSDKEYLFALPNAQAERLSYIGVKAKGKKTLLNVSAPEALAGDTEFTIYRIELPAAASDPVIKIVAVLTDYLKAYPAEITQNDLQMMKLVDSHYYYSMYHTKTQKTVVKLASSNVESYTRKVPHANRGATITFGPYLDADAKSWSDCVVHAQNHEPFAKMKTVQTDIEVSHWGSVSVEEVVELHHVGARLKHGFSRFDYQMRKGQEYGHSFRSLLAVLPGQAQDIFYRDQIGNISTSELRRVDSDLELEVQPRFPMFGGWKTQFYLGYRVPTESMLSVDSDTGRYRFAFDFYTVFEDVWVEDLEVKLVLPEGCTDVKVDLPYEASSSWTRRYTYLDSHLTGGRPVLILRGKNLVSELDSEVVVTYSFNPPRVLVEPIMLICFFFAILCGFSVLARSKDGPDTIAVATVTKKDE